MQLEALKALVYTIAIGKLLNHHMYCTRVFTWTNFYPQGPREDSTRVGRAGTVRRQAVDVSPLRRVNQAVFLLTSGARAASFRNIKSIAECFADELINAAKVMWTVFSSDLIDLSTFYSMIWSYALAVHHENNHRNGSDVRFLSRARCYCDMQ